METHFISEDADQHQSNMEMWKNQIQSLKSENLVELINGLEEEWCIGIRNNTDISSELGYKKFFLSDEINPKTEKPYRVDIELLSAKHKRMLKRIVILFS